MDAKEGKWHEYDIETACRLAAEYLSLLRLASQWGCGACASASLISMAWMLFLPHLMCFGEESWEYLPESEVNAVEGSFHTPINLEGGHY